MTDAEFDILAAEMVLGLIKGSKLVNHTIAEIQSIQSSIFNVNSDVHFFQAPDLTDSFQRIPAKAAKGLYQNQVNFSVGTVSYELLVARAVGGMDAGCNILYRVACVVLPKANGKYDIGDIKLNIRKEKIWIKDSYESCVRRLEAAQYFPCESYLDELNRIEELAWLFEYPRETEYTLELNSEDKKFPFVLENILKALDPSILKVEQSKDVPDAYVIRLQNESVILQNGVSFDTDRLSSGTKTGVEIATVVSSLFQGFNAFYYCDEKFSYIHSDVEKAILSLMIASIRPNEQLFFTTHNTDVLDMDLPKHAFTFLRKDPNDTEHPISCVSASSLLKRSSDSLKNAVENDLFSTSPAVDLIYAIAGL